MSASITTITTRVFGTYTEWVEGDERTVLFHRTGRVQRYRFDTWTEHEDGTRTGVWMIVR